MQIVIQNSGVSEYNARVIFDAAQKLGIPTCGVGIIPFTYDMTGAENIDFSIPTFWYGSTRLVEIALRNYPKSGVFLNEKFNVSGMVPVSGQPKRPDALNPQRQIMPIKRISCAEHFNDWLKIFHGGPIFVRPDSSLKTFAGFVLTKQNYKEMFDRTDFQAAQENSPNENMCMSFYEDIWAEWRFFIIDGVVVSGSLYKESGRLEMRPADRDLLMIAQCMASHWLPLPTCVMDVALTKKGLKVVEFNSVNSSGLYECNAEDILLALRDLIDA